MTDDRELERQLDEFYRKLDGSARRVEARWRSTPSMESSTLAAWLGAVVAAAAAILRLVMALRSEQRPAEGPVVKTAPIVEPAPPANPEPPPPPRLAPKPAPVERPRTSETPRPPA